MDWLMEEMSDNKSCVFEWTWYCLLTIACLLCYPYIVFAQNGREMKTWIMQTQHFEKDINVHFVDEIDMHHGRTPAIHLHGCDNAYSYC